MKLVNTLKSLVVASAVVIGSLGCTDTKIEKHQPSFVSMDYLCDYARNINVGAYEFADIINRSNDALSMEMIRKEKESNDWYNLVYSYKSSYHPTLTNSEAAQIIERDMIIVCKNIRE
jgi:hypothetical protein